MLLSFFMAYQLQKYEDSGWIDVTLSSGISVGSVDGALKYRKINNIVYISGDVTGLTGASQLIGTIPTGYRPKYNLYFVVFSQWTSATSYGRGCMSATGNLYIEWVSDNDYSKAWYSINCTYVAA